MSAYQAMKLSLQFSIISCLISATTVVYADDAPRAPTAKEAKYTGPSVEDNIAMMDTDKNGFADVFEVRAFLALKHGKDYEKVLLDAWESSAHGKSCSYAFCQR